MGLAYPDTGNIIREMVSQNFVSRLADAGLMRAAG